MYLRTDKLLAGLEVARDHLAAVIKGDLENAAFQNKKVSDASDLTAACRGLISTAAHISVR